MHIGKIIFNNPYQLLLERGANVNKLDVDHQSPLTIACGTGGARCIDVLVKYGADINH